MPIYKGGKKIAAIYHGSTKIGRVYKGSTLVYDSAAGQGGGAGDPTMAALAGTGAYYDPSYTSSLWQDEAKTVPVTADGHSVRVMEDLSGNGYHAVAPTDANRPIYRTDGTLHWLELSSTGPRVMLSTPALSLTDQTKSNSPQFAHVGGWQVSGTSDALFGLGDNNRNYFYRSSNTELVTVSQSASLSTLTSGANITVPCVVTIQGYTDNDCQAWVNGANSVTNKTMYDLGNLSVPQLVLFAQTNAPTISATWALNGKFYGGIWPQYANLSATDRATAEAYFKAKAGVP